MNITNLHLEIITSSNDIVTPKIKSKNKKFLEEAEPLENKQPIVINKSINIDDSTDADESKSAMSESKSEGKFRKRFMNRLPKNSGKIEDAGEYQWIHKPTVEIDRSHSQQLFVQLQSWNENLKDLVTRLGMYLRVFLAYSTLLDLPKL